MTQIELEQITRHVRDKGLHSSWNELMEFSNCVVANLIDVYQILLRNSGSPDSRLSNRPDDMNAIVLEKLTKALTSLTSEEKVSRWRSDALLESDVTSTQ